MKYLARAAKLTGLMLGLALGLSLSLPATGSDTAESLAPVPLRQCPFAPQNAAKAGPIRHITNPNQAPNQRNQPSSENNAKSEARIPPAIFIPWKVRAHAVVLVVPSGSG